MVVSTCWSFAAGHRRTRRSPLACLEDLVTRGLRADRRRLFVIDGAKALRQAIGRVFRVGEPGATL